MTILEQPRLLITPKPEPDEGLMGYILRLTEVNSYGALSRIFKLSGVKVIVSNGGKCTLYRSEWDTSNLERLTGLGREEIDSLRHRKIDLLSPAIPVRPSDLISVVRYESPKICPTCLTESNYCRSCWDLLPLTACHTHKTLLIDLCPECGRRISWVRKRVSVCRCGFDWRKAVPPRVAPSYLKLSRHIISLLDESAEQRNSAKDKSNPLYTLGLGDLCRALTFIADSYLFVTEGRRISEFTENLTCHHAYRHAYDVFNNWPADYHRFLEWIKRRGGRDIHDSKFTDRLFRKCDRRSLYFMLIATEDFIENNETKLRRDLRLPLPDRRFFHMNEVCLMLGTEQVWLDKLISQGKLDAVADWGSSRTLVEGKSITYLAYDLYGMASVREAARILNINPEEIESLVREGCLKPTSGPTVDGLPKWRYDKDEINELLEKIRGRLPKIKPTVREHLINTDEVFRLLKGSEISSGRFIRAVIEGEIKPRKEEYTYCGKQSFQFSTNCIKKFIRAHRRRKMRPPPYVTAGTTFLTGKKRQNDRMFTSHSRVEVFRNLFSLQYAANVVGARRRHS